MSLTINTTPTAISNLAVWNVTTSLVEDSTHVNLRIRCDVEISSVIVATVEKPKGLPNFDLADILKSTITGIVYARNAGAVYFVSGGSPLAAYYVTFTEVWENASGVLTTGDVLASAGQPDRYVPARATDFVSYILVDDDAFACQSLRTGISKFYTVNPYEYWVVFFTLETDLELFFSRDGGAWDHSVHFTVTNGWGAIVLNSGVNGLMNGVTSNLRIQLGVVAGAKISEVMTITVDSTQVDERVVLEFDGDYGGKEYLAFDGLKDIQHVTERNYRTAANKNRKPISFKGVGRQKIETLFKDMNNTTYLKSLMLSEDVKRLELVYAAPTEVTVVSDAISITKGRELFVNQLEIEYEY